MYVMNRGGQLMTFKFNESEGFQLDSSLSLYENQTPILFLMDLPQYLLKGIVEKDN